MFENALGLGIARYERTTKTKRGSTPDGLGQKQAIPEPARMIQPTGYAESVSLEDGS
ncbi:hypothetical protein WN55_06272 [Dufourea novaeangliae]|uniref:Uncharacterized protein n=1 Tax=Dufourea novaeangliae TaxID=178035 RepID=A0A154PPV1_DUFNO|nr:hypothetical protein WN55_06272 [Dufourea novaeangliae]